MTIMGRFMDKVSPEPNSGCWLWTAYTNVDGYGMMMLSNGPERAHRIAYRLFRTEISEGMTIDHKCKVKCCVNPDHLEVVTRRENIIRRGYSHGARRNILKTHCPQGHPYSGANLRTDLHGGRHCLTCDKYYTRMSNTKKRSV